MSDLPSSCRSPHCFFVAGDIADRYNRRRILALSYAVQAVAVALLLGLTLLSAKSQWPFYAALILLGSARAFGQPAGQSFLPQLVSGGAIPAGGRVDILGTTNRGHLRARARRSHLYLGTAHSLRGLPFSLCHHQYCAWRAAHRQPAASARPGGRIASARYRWNQIHSLEADPSGRDFARSVRGAARRRHRAIVDEGYQGCSGSDPCVSVNFGS